MASNRRRLAIFQQPQPETRLFDSHHAKTLCIRGGGSLRVVSQNGSVWEEVGEGSASDGGIRDNNYGSYVPSNAIAPNGTPYITWSNDSSGDREIYV